MREPMLGPMLELVQKPKPRVLPHRFLLADRDRRGLNRIRGEAGGRRLETGMRLLFVLLLLLLILTLILLLLLLLLIVLLLLLRTVAPRLGRGRVNRWWLGLRQAPKDLAGVSEPFPVQPMGPQHTLSLCATPPPLHLTSRASSSQSKTGCY